MKNSNIYLLVIFFSLRLTSYSQQKASIGFLANLKTHGHKGSNMAMQSKPSAVYAPGRVVNYNWNLTTNIWALYDTSLLAYNSQGLPIEKVSRYGSPSSKRQINYDSKGRIIEEIIQSWNSFSNQWINNGRYVTLYDSNDNMIEYRSEQFDIISNQWEITWGDRYIITYNSNNWMISKVSQNWNYGLSVWEDSDRTIFSAHTGSGLPTLYEMQNKVGTNWENDSRITDTYSIFGELVEEMIELWDGSAYKKDERYTNVTWHNWTGDPNTNAIGSYTAQVWGSPGLNQWNTVARSFSNYDSYGGSVSTYQDYINALWVNVERYSDFYDVNFNSTGWREESWITSTNSWNIDYEQKITHNYAFGGTGQINESIWQQWSSVLMTFVNDRKEAYSDFVLISGIGSASNLINSEIFVFPNPFNSSCTVRFNDPALANKNTFTFQLLDLFGKVVSQTNIGGQETRIEKGNLVPGIYFYSVIDKTNTVAKGKLVIQ